MRILELNVDVNRSLPRNQVALALGYNRGRRERRFCVMRLEFANRAPSGLGGTLGVCLNCSGTPIRLGRALRCYLVIGSDLDN
jgi:hypothetical protein